MVNKFHNLTIEKNKIIGQKVKETREPRKNQIARVFEIKLDKSKILEQKSNNLKRLFLEGKWFMNYIISKGVSDVVSYKEYKVKKVETKVKDKFEDRDLNELSSQIKQYIIKRLQNNMKMLKTLDRKGNKTGKLKYRKAIHLIPLMQYGITYKIEGESRTVHIQGIGNFKAIGLDQLPENAEFANADFMERNDNYFLHIVTYISKEEETHNKNSIGIDLGMRNQIAFSKSQYDQKTKVRSKRGYKLLKKIKKEYEYKNNIKKDINNKLVSYVTKNYEYVAYQDDAIHAWQKLYGRRIYQTSIGEFRNALKRKASNPMEISRFKKTTGICMNCGASLHLYLSERMFKCPFCGHSYDRDLSAAEFIRIEGLYLRNAGETPAEDYATTSKMLEYIKSISHLKASIAYDTESSKRTVEAEAPFVKAVQFTHG